MYTKYVIIYTYYIHTNTPIGHLRRGNLVASVKYEYTCVCQYVCMSTCVHLVSIYEYIGCSLSLSLYLSLLNLVVSVKYEYTCVCSTCI